MLAGRYPILLRVRVNLEDMSSGAVDGLLPEGQKVKVMNLLWTQYGHAQGIWIVHSLGPVDFTLHEQWFSPTHTFMYGEEIAVKHTEQYSQEREAQVL